MNKNSILLDSDIKERASSNIREVFHGKIEQANIDAMLDKINEIHVSPNNTYYHTFTITSKIVYQKIYVEGKTIDKVYWSFTGNAGGFFAPGHAGGMGDVYTNDLDKLHLNTRTFFMYNILGAYTAFYFYDHDHSLLGHFQGAFGGCPGTGGGTGHWEKTIVPPFDQKK